MSRYEEYPVKHAIAPPVEGSQIVTLESEVHKEQAVEADKEKVLLGQTEHGDTEEESYDK